MGYKDNRETREAIDVVLKTNALLFVNLGIESTKKEREQAKVQERKNLRDIMELDRPFIKALLDEKD
jgi:hypothetical protein